MKFLFKTKPFAYTFTVTVALLCAGVVLAWTGPSTSPPSGNASAPLNTSATAQIKNGIITASSVGATSLCIGGDCRFLWPSGGTSQWITAANGTSIYYNSGNVGVGTAAPGERLSVTNDTANITEGSFGFAIVSAPGQTKLALGASNAGGYSVIQSLQTGVSWTNRPLVLQPNGGNVGIGTAAPLAGLHINTVDTTHGVAGGYVPLRITDPTNAGNSWALVTRATEGALSIADMTNAAIRLQINSNGNVGIGTQSPGAKLTVQGAGSTGYTSATFIVQDNATPSKGLYMWYDPTDDVSQIQSIQYGTAVKNLVLQGAGGNVGIGTLTPAQKLDVAGSIRATDVCTTGGKCLSTVSGGASGVYPFGGLYEWNSTLGRCEDSGNPLGPGTNGGCSCPTWAPTPSPYMFATTPNGSGVYFEDIAFCY